MISSPIEILPPVTLVTTLATMLNKEVKITNFLVILK